MKHNTEKETEETPRPEPLKRQRLSKIHYDTANAIRLYVEGSDRSQRQRLTIWLKRLATDAGVERGELTQSELYKRAIGALLEKQGDDVSYPALRVQEVAREMRRRACELARQLSAPQSHPAPPAEQAATPAYPPVAGVAACRVKVCAGYGAHFEPFGIQADDYLYIDDAERELQPGELAALLEIDDNAWHSGIVESVTPDAITFSAWGKSKTLSRANLQRVGRVTWFARRVRPASVDKAKQKIKRLRDRLDELNETDDITDCSARFKLEKQIYKLEREQAAEEWPEIIGVGGVR